MSYTQFDPSDFVISSDSITAPAWSSNTPTLTTFFTASGQIASNFYLDVYNTSSLLTNAAVQYSIAYGNAVGSGSLALNNLVPGNTPSRITYGQFRNLVYGNPTTYFNFGGLNTASLDILAISVDRNRYKESLMPGTFNLTLSSSVGSIQLTDNSNDVSTITYLDCGRVFNIVSGSYGTSNNTIAPLGTSTRGYTASGSYGLFLPDIATLILNPRALALPFASGGLNLSFYSGSSVLSNAASSSLNAVTTHRAIQSGSNFQLLSQETISSDYVFVRIKNAEYNYSTNPSFISGSGGLLYSNFINNPQTYITTVGLYNTNNDLLAVAKLSIPLVKDFTKEALITVKLDW
jgi:hypothetical protein